MAKSDANSEPPRRSRAAEITGRRTREIARFEDPKIHAFEDRMMRAKPVALDEVKLTGGPLQHAQQITRTIAQPRP